MASKKNKRNYDKEEVSTATSKKRWAFGTYDDGGDDDDSSSSSEEEVSSEEEPTR
jgi:hypothetical protein